MPTFSSLSDALAIARSTTRDDRKALIAAQERVKQLDFLLRTADANGEEPDAGLVTEYENLVPTGIQALQDQLDADIVAENDAYDAVFTYYENVKDALAEMPETLPVLLFPIRIETAFDVEASKLLVRIYPDDIAIETHEPPLTSSEISSGKDYWRNAIDSAKKAAAWDVLSRNFGAPRAAWIIKTLTPTNLTSNPTDPDDLVFPDPETKFDSWTQQPQTRILPDAFIVTAYHYASSTTLEAIGTRIDYSVKLGIDPENPDSMKQEVDNTVSKEPSLEWMYDYSAAEAAGLGIGIEFADSEQMENGFDRLVVLGVKFSVNSEDSQVLVEDLFDNHHYTKGFSLLEQGTATNNTNTIQSGYVKREFGNVKTFDAETGSELFTPSANTMLKSDGQILADMLGIDYTILQHTANSDRHGIRNAIAMNNVLWEATGGYYLREMLYPLCDDTTLQATRTFFANNVLGGGNIPGIRVGKQAYGILANSIVSSIEWPEDFDDMSTYRLIQETTEAFATTWNTLAQNANYAARSSVDPQQVIADMAARHGVSVDYYQRTGVGASYIWNNLIFSGRSEDASQWRTDQYDAAQTIATDTGLSASPTPRILQTNFLEQHAHISTPIVSKHGPNDTLPAFALSSDDPTATSINFLEWLRTATCDEIQTHDFITLTERSQKDTPRSFLYRMARQAVLLEYFHATGKLKSLTAAQLRESDFINVAPPGSSVSAGENIEGSSVSFSTYAGASRWTVLNSHLPGTQTSYGQYIDNGAESNSAIDSLLSVRNDLQHLEQLSVGELNLLIAEHLDTLSFRLDAWRLGLVSERLQASRNVVSEGESISRNMGLFIGAYGWVEGVRLRSEPTIVDPPSGYFSAPIESDANNEGFIHAPSLNHAATAAVLRSGYISRADYERPETLAVNLSSERVRMAMEYIEAIRNGSDLATLLGYQMERGMHERYPSLGLDKYINALRDKYPLHGLLVSRSESTSTDAIASRSVMNGLKLAQDYRALLAVIANTQPPNTPPDPVDFLLEIPGFSNLAIPDESEPLLKELDRLENILDAIGDLSVAEGVFQTVQGNTVKANAMVSAVASDKHIPIPDVVKTPRTGTHLNNRITLNFDPLVYPETTRENSFWDPEIIPESARSKAEPTFNNWLKILIGDPTKIVCKVFVSTIEDYIDINLSQLKIQPIDYLNVLPEKLQNDSSALSELVRRHVRQATSSTNDARIIIYYADTVDSFEGMRTFYELHALMVQAKKVLGNSRNLKTTDFLAPSLGGSVKNAFDVDDASNRYLAAKGDLEAAQTELENEIVAFPEDFAAFVTAADYDYYREALYKCSFYGIQGTVFESNSDFSQGTFDALVAAGSRVNAEMNSRKVAVTAMGIPDPATLVTLAEKETFIADIQKAIGIIFGNAFRFIPHYLYCTEEAAVLNYLDDNNGGTLLNDYAAGSLITEEWLQGIARVRKKSGDFELLSLLASAWNIDLIEALALRPAQFPYANDGFERWMAVKVTTAEGIKQNRLAIGMCVPPQGFNATDEEDVPINQSGLMIDEWAEVIPNSSEITGVAFHYDQPESKPPQCLILASSPTNASENGWAWDTLLEIVNNTLDEAKRRAVDSEDLATTSYGHLLPAVIMPFTTANTTIGLTHSEIN